MTRLSRDDLREIEAYKDMAKMQRLTAVRSQLHIAQAALDPTIILAEERSNLTGRIAMAMEVEGNQKPA